jgi:hypothetical protein
MVPDASQDTLNCGLIKLMTVFVIKQDCDVVACWRCGRNCRIIIPHRLGDGG